MKKGIEDGSGAYHLQSVHHNKSNLIIEFPMLWWQIISRKSQWGQNMLFYREFDYIHLYWEWTEHLQSYFRQHLKNCSLHQAVYASLYSYSRDIHVLHVFCEGWYPVTNTHYNLS